MTRYPVPIVLLVIVAGCETQRPTADAAVDMADNDSTTGDATRADSQKPDSKKSDSLQPDLRDLSVDAAADAVTLDTGSDVNDAQLDAIPASDGPLYPCSSPGTSCNAHDPCAIDPKCGADLLCRPSAYQDCNDQLDCTVDICTGPGMCQHQPKPATCALAVNGTLHCFAEDDLSPVEPCRACKPAVSSFKWSPVNGTPCDDDESCTKDDYCDNGVCKGTYYGTQCQDKFSCTDDLCDGKGACLGNVLRSDSCLIDGQCHLQEEMSIYLDQCAVCDPGASQTNWTPLQQVCLIDGSCYLPQEADPTNCNVCDPQQSTTAWTPIPGAC